jgi:hypothetical protein
MALSAEHTFSVSRKTIRFISSGNFLLFVLFVVPPIQRWINHGFVALRAIGLEALVGRSLELWLVGSTLFITALLGWLFWQEDKARAARRRSESLQFEGILVAMWWLIVLGACVYGFALGMGG